MILSIDPSSTCCGYALLDDNRVCAIEESGTFKLKAHDLCDRLDELIADLRGFLQRNPDVVVIERPQVAGGPNRGGFAKQSTMSVASYGAAFGAVYGFVIGTPMPHFRKVMTPTPSQWVGRGVVPSSKGDPYKTKRVQLVEQLYGLKPGTLGPKTYAGNVADAILMGRWAGRNK